MFLFISSAEIIFVLFIVVMVFGADKVPEIARGLGKGISQIKNATNDLKSEITKSANNSGLDTSVAKDVQKELNQVKDDLEEFTGSVRRNM
ncbi:Sec-independent protein translocase subunit TatA/TatB [Formosa sp. S-31]|uniref:Sec-independent protein translocase subunit TatA/TatB n=1 Tax=Formosa sp. S-31 TaxID=2790949 RepID=UPI003EBD2C17